MPIAHNGPRGSPVTEVRNASPAIATATATVAPGGTATGAPFTVIVTWSGMGEFLLYTGGQVGLNRDLGLRAGDLIRQDFRRRQRRRDTESFMSSGEENRLIAERWTDQRELIGGGSSKSGPCSYG